MDSFNKIPQNCYNLSAAQLITDTDEIIVQDYSQTTPFILETSAKRYNDLKKMNSKKRPLKTSYFEFRDELLNSSRLILTGVKNVYKHKFSNLTYICGQFVTAVGDDNASDLEYYKTAMQVHRITADERVFVIICNESSFKYCIDNLQPYTDVVVVKKDITDEFLFTFMAACNRTIITDELTAAAAIVNNGIATIPSDDEVLNRIGNNIPKWYYVYPKAKLVE